MVCGRCITIVRAELDKIGIDYIAVELGEITILRKLSSAQHKQLFIALKKVGFELINDLKNNLIEKLKKTIGNLERNSDEELKTSYTDYLSINMKDDFVSLNTLLAEIKGISIEKYIIKHKIELVKELLLNKKLKLEEIAIKMHYSNVAQLSSQFKSITGLTPLKFRRLQRTGSNRLDVN